MWTKELIAEAHAILDAMITDIEIEKSWAGQVDRQGGSFTDREIMERLTNWH